MGFGKTLIQPLGVYGVHDRSRFEIVEWWSTCNLFTVHLTFSCVDLRADVLLRRRCRPSTDIVTSIARWF